MIFGIFIIIPAVSGLRMSFYQWSILGKPVFIAFKNFAEHEGNRRFQVIMVPIFLLLKNSGLLNTRWGIIIPPAATPTGIFITKQYMLTILDSLIEAARIDGGGEWFIFRL